MRKWLLLGLLILFTGCPSTEVNSARIYIERGEFQRAKEQILIGLKNDPNNWELQCLLGKAEIGLYNWKEASAAFHNAIKIDSLTAVDWILKDKKNESVYWQAFYNSAIAFEMEEKYNEALSDLKFCELLDPKKVDVYIMRGKIYSALGKKEQASQAYAKALKIDPENPHAYYLIGEALFDEKKYDSALVKLDGAIKYYDKNYKTVAKAIFQNLPEIDKALAQQIIKFKEAKKDEELDELVKVKLGFDGGLKAQQRNIDNFYKLTQGFAMAYYLAGISQYNLKNNEAALTYLSKNLELTPDDRKALFYTGDLLIRANKYKEALAYFERITEIQDDDIYSWFYIGVINMQLKEYKKAIDILEGKVLVLNPKFVDALNNLAFCYREIGNTKKALEYLQKAEKIQKEQ
jgi:tetratricopeptide (TPR) repeat protein